MKPLPQFAVRRAACLAALFLAACSSEVPAGSGEAARDAGVDTEPTADEPVSEGDAGVPSAVDCVPLDPIPRRLWRLSMAQFSNSVRDLLKLPTGPIVNDTGGSAEYAFFSDTSGTVSGTLAFSLYEAVQSTLNTARPQLAELASCAAEQSEDECAGDFARTFGARAFRRALEPAEVDALLAVYAEGRKQDFALGIESMLEALLQSPSFLYRSELGATETASGEAVLTPHEIAAQLSYFFLDSTPDAELIAAADSGVLSTPDGLTAQVDRLLASETVRQNVNRIVADWFGARQVLSKTTKATQLLESLSDADRDQAGLALDLLHSTRLFIDDILWQRALPIDDLLRSQRMFVNRRLATLYGLPFSGPGGDFLGVYFPEEQQRAGILTHPAVLWAVSDPDATSIVHRGLYVHNDVLCLEPVPSPGDLLEQPDIQAALAMLSTEREKSEYRMNDAICRTCHAQIDPFGLVLEGFDPVGAHRATEDGEAIDATGEFTLSPSLQGAVTGAQTFAQGVADDGLFSACATQKVASYAIGRTIRKRATCEVQDVHAAFSAGDGTMESLFRQVALAAFLRSRTGSEQ